MRYTRANAGSNILYSVFEEIANNTVIMEVTKQLILPEVLVISKPNLHSSPNHQLLKYGELIFVVRNSHCCKFLARVRLKEDRWEVLVPGKHPISSFDFIKTLLFPLIVKNIPVNSNVYYSSLKLFL